MLKWLLALAALPVVLLVVVRLPPVRRRLDALMREIDDPSFPP